MLSTAENKTVGLLQDRLALPGNIKELDILFNDSREQHDSNTGDEPLSSQLKEPGSEEPSYTIHSVDQKQYYNCLVQLS